MKQPINHGFLKPFHLCRHHALGIARYLDHQLVVGRLRIVAPTTPLRFGGTAGTDGNEQRPFELPFLARQGKSNK